MPRRRTMLLAMLSTLTLTTAACGSDEETGTASGGATPTAAAPAAAATEGPEATMRAYFTAISAGDTKTICDLEDDTLEQFKYNATGDACLQNASNQNAQPAIPTGEQITVSSTDVVGDTATYTVQDQKGASIQVGLEQNDGRWLVHVFT